MTLNRVLQKRNHIVLGLNSGTSADGLDLAAVKCLTRSNKTGSVIFLAGQKKKYPAALRVHITKTMHARNIPVDELIYLDNLIGRFFGKEASKFIDALFAQGIRIDAIASHGQTIRHLPVMAGFLGQRVRGTLQLGSSEFIAAATGKTVISDFRQADIAVGNEGAPITSHAVRELFSDSREPRLLLNIGGIANYFYIPTGKRQEVVESADCGPGNSLSDYLSTRLFGENFDRHGRRAASGQVSERLLALLSADPFYIGPAKSTGKEVFGETMGETMITFGRKFKIPGVDLLATAVELTVRSIAWKVLPLLRRDRDVKKMYLTGGGRDNIFLVKRLQLSLPEVHVCRIDELGIPGDFVEAASYAMLGEACLRGRPMSNMGPDGRRPVLGRITQPPVGAGS